MQTILNSFQHYSLEYNGTPELANSLILIQHGEWCPAIDGGEYTDSTIVAILPKNKPVTFTVDEESFVVDLNEKLRRSRLFTSHIYCGDDFIQILQGRWE